MAAAIPVRRHIDTEAIEDAVREAEHACMSMRGVRKPGAITVTSAIRGAFKSDPATRAEAMDLLQRPL